MFLLKFVNEIRHAQAREPLQVLEIGEVPALEQAMHCRFDDSAMRFESADVAEDVAVSAGLPLAADPDAVELPAAIHGYIELCATG